MKARQKQKQKAVVLHQLLRRAVWQSGSQQSSMVHMFICRGLRFLRLSARCVVMNSKLGPSAHRTYAFKLTSAVRLQELASCTARRGVAHSCICCARLCAQQRSAYSVAGSVCRPCLPPRASHRCACPTVSVDAARRAPWHAANTRPYATGCMSATARSKFFLTLVT